MDEKHRNSIFGPLLLVAIGVLLLLNTLGVIEGSLWGIFLRLWPVLLIVSGLDGLYKRENFVGPVLIIGIGTMFLLANLGYLALGSWQMILRLWPVLLIAFGLDLLVGRRSLLSAVLGIALGLALIAGIVWLTVVAPQGAQALEMEKINQTLQGASSADVAVVAVAGNLSIRGGAEPANLAEGMLTLRAGENLTQSYQVQGGRGSLKIQSKGNNLMLPGPAFNNAGMVDWQIKLNQTVPLDLTSTLVFGEQQLDLRKIKVEDLKSETVFGKTELTLPADSSFEGEVSVVFGELVVLVPRNTAVRIEADTALTSITWPQGFQKEGDWILSPGAKKDGAGMLLKLEQPFGSVRIQYAP